MPTSMAACGRALLQHYNNKDAHAMGRRATVPASIRCILAFYIFVFLHRVLYIFSPSYTYIYSGLRFSDEYKCYS
jgi:hypothetical protein